MDESVYAQVIAERIKSREISRREWKIVRQELKNRLKEVDSLNAEKVLGEAEMLRVGMKVDGWLDEIYEEEGESIGSIIDREVALDKLRKQAPNGALNGFEAKRLPPYLLRDFHEIKDGIEMTAEGTDREYKVRVDWKMMKSAVEAMRRIEEPITPYKVRREARVNPDRSKAIALYLWKKSILKPRGYRKSGKYDSINFELDEEKAEEFLSEKSAESDPEQAPKFVLRRGRLDL